MCVSERELTSGLTPHERVYNSPLTLWAWYNPYPSEVKGRRNPRMALMSWHIRAGGSLSLGPSLMFLTSSTEKVLWGSNSRL